MDPSEIIAKLYRGGFNSKLAGDIIEWMAEPWHYNRVAALEKLDEMYEDFAANPPFMPETYMEQFEHLRQDLELHGQRPDRKPVPVKVFKGTVIET